MFKWGRRWAPGLIPLVIIWGLSGWFTTVPVENNLSDQGRAAIKDMVLDGASVTVEGRDLRLSANAFSEEGRLSALAAVESVPGVRRVNDATGLLAEAKPFVWTANRDVVRVTLGGNAPLPAAKARLMDAARADLPGVEIADRMSYARGAPPRFEAAAQLLIDQIARLKEAQVSISDNSIKLAGMAREIGGREAIAAALRNLPEGFSVAENAIQAPPYIFQVNKDPVAATLTLSGYVPDNAVHAAVVAAIGRKFSGEKVVDSLKASVGAPQGFAAAVTTALSTLSRLSTGSLVISDREVKLSGDALFEVAASQIREGAGGPMPQGWTYKADVSVKPAASSVDSTICQQLFSELLGKERIRFESGKADISPDSIGLLDRLIATTLRCPTTNIEIGGHTDTDGDAAANVTLSQKRAEAVLNYLIRAGLSSERLTAVGFGSAQPMASNDTAEGKAQNRRIDFVVK